MAKSYTTILGDTWDTVSLTVYGSELFIDRLMRANPAHMETVIFSAGVVLAVPDIDTAASREPNAPWQR